MTQARGNVLRWAAIVIAALAILLTVSSTSNNRVVLMRPISLLSLTMQHQGDRLHNAQEFDEAIGYYEASLVADPRNADAFIGLGRVAQAQALPGKAIGHYRAALALRPADRTALVLQGEALVARGALARAQTNLARLRELCGRGECADVVHLSRVVDGRSSTALSAEAIRPRPTIAPASPSN